MENDNNVMATCIKSTNNHYVFHSEEALDHVIQYVLSSTDICIDNVNLFSWKNDVVTTDASKSLSPSELIRYIQILSGGRDSRIELENVYKSNLCQYEAIYSIKKSVLSGDLSDKGWFIPGMLHWKQILHSLLDTELKDNGTFFVRNLDLYIKKKKELKLSGKYWIYPASFSDNIILYIDFDRNLVLSTDVFLNEKNKVRPIRVIDNNNCTFED